MRDLLLPPATTLPALTRATAAALWLLIVVGGIVRPLRQALHVAGAATIIVLAVLAVRGRSTTNEAT